MTKRSDIRDLKRAVSKARSAEAMRTLLQRSMKFGHRRRALLRCIQAVRMGIALTPEVLSYCQHMADSMTLPELRSIDWPYGPVDHRVQDGILNASLV